MRYWFWLIVVSFALLLGRIAYEELVPDSEEPLDWVGKYGRSK